jgi:bifunctional ADP-heptose synthase (sugar kinase/adenylyltransferase)
MRIGRRSIIAAVLMVSLVFGTASFASAAPKKPCAKANKIYRQAVGTGSLVRNLASLAETSPASVNAMRAQGRSLESIAASLGVDPAAVIAVTQSRLVTKLNKLVTAGKLSRARADALIAKSALRLDRLMKRVPPVLTPAGARACPAQVQRG